MRKGGETIARCDSVGRGEHAGSGVARKVSWDCMEDAIGGSLRVSPVIFLRGLPRIWDSISVLPSLKSRLVLEPYYTWGI